MRILQVQVFIRFNGTVGRFCRAILPEKEDLPACLPAYNAWKSAGTKFELSGASNDESKYIIILHSQCKFIDKRLTYILLTQETETERDIEKETEKRKFS